MDLLRGRGHQSRGSEKMFEGIKRMVAQQPLVMFFLTGAAGHDIYRLYLNWGLSGAKTCEFVREFLVSMAISLVVVGWIYANSYRKSVPPTQQNYQRQ